MQITGRIMADSKRGQELGLVNPIEFTGNYDFPETLEGCVEKFGKEVVLEAFYDKAVVAAQAVTRNIAEQIHLGKCTQEEGQARLNSWKLGSVVRTGENSRNPVAKAKALAGSMSKEQRLQLMAELQASIEAE